MKSPSVFQPCAGERSDPVALAKLITVEEFAELSCLSRRHVDRLRKLRPPGFPREYDLGNGSGKFRRCPRFRLHDVIAWIETRALW
jgi:predicted DNA-binding transcriptional regulator AlpA